MNLARQNRQEFLRLASLVYTDRDGAPCRGQEQVFRPFSQNEDIALNEPTDQNSKAGKIIGITLVMAMAYAVLRYHIAGDVPWKDLPFYITNKGLSLSAFILLSLNFGLGPARNLGVPVPQAWLNARKALGMTGFLLVLIHALISFMLFSPAVYPNFFDANGTVTGLAGISMLAGVMGFVFLWALNLSFQTYLREDTAFISFITSPLFLNWALLLGGLHLFFMGYAGWMKPAGWQGGLPPISLVAFTFFCMGYLANLLGRK